MKGAVVWTERVVGQCLVPTSFRSKGQIQARDYLPAGRYPVIDQGQSVIAGWTDDDSAVINAPLPVVVFGDHSRALKFVDFPFVRGADGTQVLVPASDLDPLYFYYACKFIDVPARGYNRHFSHLKESVFACPESFDLQRSIARVLRGVDRAISQEAARCELAMAIKQAAMASLFTRGLRGEAQKETEIGWVPASWDVVPLGQLGRVGNGSTPKRSIPAYWTDGTYPWLTSAKVYDREITRADQFVTSTALAECHLPKVQPGALLMAITGQGKTLGHCAVLQVEATVSQHVAYVQTDLTQANPGFVRGYLETQYDYLRQIGAGGGSTKGALTCSFLRSLPIPLPSKPEQDEIVEVLDAIDRKIALHQLKRAVLEDLFKALLHKLMTGEIDVNELNLQALSAHEPAIEASLA